MPTGAQSAAGSWCNVAASFFSANSRLTKRLPQRSASVRAGNPEIGGIHEAE
jgi:hypothetical protein